MRYIRFPLLLCTGIVLMASSLNVWSDNALSSNQTEGKKLALEFCQACHLYQGTEQAGTVAPPLVGMKQRFPNRKTLFNIIYDPHKSLSKDTMMPPFGRNELMTKDEIEKVIDFLYTL